MNLPTEIKLLVNDEFLGKGINFQLEIYCLKDKPKDDVPMGGCYVYWKNGQVLKVGKSKKNVLVRATNHLYNNTKNDKLEMGSLMDDKDTFIFLFKSPNHHWVMALEYFLEEKLNPLIPSDRKG